MKQQKTMKIKTMYRTQCLAAVEGYGPEYDTDNIMEPTLIVSISSTDDTIPEILEQAPNDMVRHVEFLQFDDIDASATIGGLIPMREDDANRIIDAFLKYKDKVSQIIVHCDAGYSRSPAVAAALCITLGTSDAVFFGPGYCPNTHVYRTMLRALEKRNII